MGGGDTEGYYDESDDTHNLFGVFVSEDDDSPHPIGLLEKVEKIKTIRIPSSVKVITNYCFKHIQDGKNINIPDIEEPLDGDERMVKESLIKQFTEVKWNQITASPKNEMFRVENGCLLSEDGKKLYGFVQKKSQIVIPGTVKRITVGGDYNGAGTVVIPKAVKKIEKGALSSWTPVTVKVAKGNKRYAVSDGSVYSKVSGRLVLGYVKDGILKVPDKVRKIDCEIGKGYVGKIPKKAIIPKGVKEIRHLLARSQQRS